ncbi:MAG TPA: hypothetical protein VN848_06840 [Gemmatimonadales bacterium]|nr:hypothetical protein [Gemmatimonadales bacterium]
MPQSGDWQQRIRSAVEIGTARELAEKQARETSQQQAESDYLANLRLYDAVVKPAFEEAVRVVSGSGLAARIDERPLISQAANAPSFDSSLLIAREAQKLGARVTFKLLKVSSGITIETHSTRSGRVNPMRPSRDELTSEYVGGLVAEFVEEIMNAR